MHRRDLLLKSTSALSGLTLAACAHRAPAPAAAVTPTLPCYDALAPILPIRAHIDRIFRITVCLRPFRAAGPRLDVETVADKLVFHNYGHGGSGWSLSWGSADVVLRKIADAGESGRDLAVIGCGALGLTAAITAQRVGMRVTIYAKERPPFVRSSRATGSWTPSSRVALTSAAAPEFASQWESMARTSFSMYQSFLGLAGNPIEWTDRYILSDTSHDQQTTPRRRDDSHGFVAYDSRLADITPRSQDLPAGSHPFPTKYVRRTTSLTFNVAGYSRQLINDFLIAGGSIETREFHAPQDLGALPQRAIVNCTGYAARQLWADESIVPVRGQIAWLIPQEGVNYGFGYENLNVLARRDGIVVQPSPQGDDTGWNDSNENPDRAEAEAAVLQLQALCAHMSKPRLAPCIGTRIDPERTLPLRSNT